MRLFFSLALISLFTSFSAQETVRYPFNPDANGDTFVGVSDVLEGISTYDNFFSPSEIMIGDTSLSNWIQILSQALQDQQAVIESFTAITINEVLHLSPLEESPSNPTMGDVYYDAPDNSIKHYDGVNWVEVKNTNNSGPTFIPMQPLVALYQQGSSNWVTLNVSQYVPESAKAVILNFTGIWQSSNPGGLRADINGPLILPPIIGQVIVPLSPNNTFDYNNYYYDGNFIIELVGYY